MTTYLIRETKKLRKKRIPICPYIIDLEIKKRDLQHPFNLQSKKANLEQTKQLVPGIYKALVKRTTNVDTLERAVDSNWEELEKEFERIRSEKPPDHEEMIKNFMDTFVDVNNYRKSLKFSSSVDEAIRLFENNQYNRQTIVDHALKIIKEKRNPYDKKSILVGNVSDLLEEHFSPDKLWKIIGRLESIITSDSERKNKR